MESNEQYSGDTAVPSAVTAPPPGEPPLSSASEGGSSGSRRWIWVFLAALVLVAIGVGSYLFLGNLGAQRSASEAIDDAAVLLESADAVVIDVDEVIRSEVDEELGLRAEDLISQLASAIEDLEEAVSLVDGALADLAEDDVEYARAVRASAAPRIEMLQLAEGLLEANVKAAAALEPAFAAWDKVLEAEAVSDQAVAKYNELTKESVTESTQLSEQAEGLLTEARSLFSEATTGFPEADFSAYIEYCDGKAELLALSKQADQQWLAGKIVDANATIKTYNEKEAVLIEHAKTLPESPVEVVAVAYESLAAEDTDAYFEARTRATSADAALQEMGGAGNGS